MNAPEYHIVKIDQKQLNKLVAHAESTSDECCGFLLGHDREGRFVTEVLPAKNVAAERSIRFEVDPLEYLRAERYAASHHLDLLGIYHSHPNTTALPSDTDRREAQPYFSYVILSLITQRVTDIRSWRLNGKGQFDEEIVMH